MSDEALIVGILGCLTAIVLLLPSRHTGPIKPEMPGGLLAAHYEHIEIMQTHGETIALTGTYISAAVQYLRVASCVAPDAVFLVHEARDVPVPVAGGPDMSKYWSSMRNDDATRESAEKLPACVREIFDKKRAFDYPAYTRFSGKEILKACPTIPSCVS